MSQGDGFIVVRDIGADGTFAPLDVSVLQPGQRFAVVLGGSGAGGRGIPPGGLAGQVLTKLSDADFDVGWADVELPGGSLDWSRPTDTGLDLLLAMA